MVNKKDCWLCCGKYKSNRLLSGFVEFFFVEFKLIQMVFVVENSEMREEEEEKMDESSENIVILKEGLCLKCYYGYLGFVYI